MAKLAEEPVDILAESASNTVDPEGKSARPFDLASIIDKRVQIDIYDSRPVGAEQPVVSLNDLADAVDMAMPKGTNSSNSSMMGLAVMKESMYNTYLDFRGMDRVDLGEDGYLITSDMGESVNKIYNAVMDKDVEIEFGGRTLHLSLIHI